jgi:hypothetical protein
MKKLIILYLQAFLETVSFIGALAVLFALAVVGGNLYGVEGFLAVLFFEFVLGIVYFRYDELKRINGLNKNS